MQQLSNVVVVVADTHSPFDDLDDAPGCPQVGPIALAQGPFQQEFNQLGCLLGLQAGRTTRSGLGTKSCRSAPLPLIPPSQHAGRATPHPPRHFGQRMALLQQADGPDPSSLQFFRLPAWSHGHILLLVFPLYYFIYADINKKEEMPFPYLKAIVEGELRTFSFEHITLPERNKPISTSQSD